MTDRDIPRTSSLEYCIRLACVIEATARKPGNVHPNTSFEDLTYADFVRAADAAAPLLARASESGVGRAVLEAVRAVRERCSSNVNLGIILLIAPLAAVPRGVRLLDGVESVLESLTHHDAEHVYEAIRQANPGGMGQVKSQDFAQRPDITLRQAMQLAADRDLIAAEYASGFPLVLHRGLLQLADPGTLDDDWETTVIRLHLTFMAESPDTLISRKCGREIADESARRARQVLDAGWPQSPRSQTLFAEFDNWLRFDGHRRNPGTTADLVAASLFAAFRETALRITPEARDQIEAFSDKI